MKEIKKESLKKLSKDNLKRSIIILSIRTIINIFLLFLTMLSLSSLTDYNSLFSYTILSSIIEPTNLNTSLLFWLLISLTILSFLVFIPLKMGIYLWFSRIQKDQITSMLLIFNYYKSIKDIIKTISFKLILILRNLLALFICFAPTVGTFLLVCSKLKNCPTEYQFILRILIIISAVTILIGIAFFFKIKIIQIPANFMFVINENCNILTIIKSLNFLMRSNNIPLIKLLISFSYYIPTFIFIIPIPFIMTYFYICIYEFTKKIIYKQNQGIDSIPLTEKVVDISSQLLRF